MDPNNPIVINPQPVPPQPLQPPVPAPSSPQSSDSTFRIMAALLIAALLIGGAYYYYSSGLPLSNQQEVSVTETAREEGVTSFFFQGLVTGVVNNDISLEGPMPVKTDEGITTEYQEKIVEANRFTEYYAREKDGSLTKLETGIKSVLPGMQIIVFTTHQYPFDGKERIVANRRIEIIK